MAANQRSSSPYQDQGPESWEATAFWPDALNLWDTNIIGFVFGHTVGGTVVDIVKITGIPEHEITERIENVLHTRANELPADSDFIIRSEEFELIISIDEQRLSNVTWTHGAHSQAFIEASAPQTNVPPRGTPSSNSVVNSQEVLGFWMDALSHFSPNGSVAHPGSEREIAVIRISTASGPAMQIAIREVLDAVEQEVRQLPPGRHIFPCLIMTEDGAYRFAPSGYRWDEFHQAGTRRERPTEGRRENIEAPVEPLPIPSDDGFTRADSNLECDAEDPTPDNFINIDPPDASAAAPESHVSFGGLPPWRGRPAWPSGPLNCPAISPNPLQPNLGAAVSMLALAPQTPVLYSRNRTVHIPTLPAHEWGTLYAHRRVTPRVPRRPILTPLRPAQFLMPPPQRDRNLINPDLSGPINWRVFLPPSTARMSTRRGGPLLQGPATSPPCFCAAIMFENPSLMHWAQRWGPIRVPVHSRTITVGDVLDAVHDYASQPLTQTDLALVVPEDRKKIDQGGRLRQLRGHPHVPVPLRSDVFNNTVMFGGMRVINVSAPGSYISLRLLPDLDW